MRPEGYLTHCKYQGDIFSVSKFAHLAIGVRPEVTCVDCNEPIVLKLGTKKIHHAAHKPNASCLLSTPEGALHFNTKIYIFRQLQRSSKLILRQGCFGSSVMVQNGRRLVRRRHRACSEGQGYYWIEGWDDVQLEKAAVGTRPDILLIRGGQPLAAIEIYSKHAVDLEKRRKLISHGLPFVEVRAKGLSTDHRFCESNGSRSSVGAAWTIDQPLEWNSVWPDVPEWVCQQCEYLSTLQLSEREKWVQQYHLAQLRKAKETQQSYETHDGDRSQVRWAQAFELRDDRGNSCVCEVFVLIRDDQELCLRIGTSPQDIVYVETSTDDAAKERLNKHYHNWRREISINNQVRSITMGWVEIDKYERMMRDSDQRDLRCPR